MQLAAAVNKPYHKQHWARLLLLPLQQATAQEILPLLLGRRL
jgi:hypothetical protein